MENNNTSKNQQKETEKEERFLNIAEQRTNKIIKMIQLLGNCSNKSNYSYTEDQVKKIFEAIDEELKITKSKFEKKNSKFKL